MGSGLKPWTSLVSNVTLNAHDLLTEQLPRDQNRETRRIRSNEGGRYHLGPCIEIGLAPLVTA